MDKKFSVIVPIYNAEKYLRECLDSIVNQTYKNLEIILVNDGSKDDSLAICKEYASKDSRIILIDQKNSGVSETRNNALKIASGDYIQFVDSDDLCELNMIEKIALEIEDNDIIVFGYKNLYKDGLEDNVCIEDINTIDVLQEKLFSCGSVLGFLWNKTFKASIIKEKNIKMKKDLKFAEDLVFVLEYLKYCNNVKNIKVPLYRYRMGIQQLHSHQNSKRNCDALSAFSVIVDMSHLSEKITNYAKYEYVTRYYYFKEFLTQNYNVRKDILKNEWNIVWKRNHSVKDILRLIYVKFAYKNYINRILKISKKIENRYFE